MEFRHRVRHSTRPVVLYELIPPPQQAEEAEIQAVVDCIAEFLANRKVTVDAINLPEVRPETREGRRPQTFVPKMEPRVFAQWLRPVLPAYVAIIVNRCVVYAPRPAQLRWLLRTYHAFHIQNLVLVGGESSRIRYPGPGVTETATWISQHLNHHRSPLPQIPVQRATDYFLGGITIPTRRRPEPVQDEPARILRKMQSGIEFFTSQVLYEPWSMQRLLRDYDVMCRTVGVPPARIFLSFAPVSSSSDLQFLKWLGVEIPQEVEREILRGWLGIAWRSIRVAERILTEILDFVQAEGIRVPLGLNVEHITSRNFEISAEMIDRLTNLMARYHTPQATVDEQAERALQMIGLEWDMRETF